LIEVYKNLYVGAENDEYQVRGQISWFIVHACKEPYHRQALGYTGRAVANTHPEYLIAHRLGRFILNLVDAPSADYIPVTIIDAAVEAIQANIGEKKVLVHCNQGASRSPTIALLYLAKHTDLFRDLSFEAAATKFTTIYPLYNPARGMADFARLNWGRYA